ncbi:MAG: macro domain-containing protein [Methanoregula sp.]|nr:macro domain-containing protein [Methanoregula sp.]
MSEMFSKNLTIKDVGDNIFNSRTETLVNTVNCVGIMGKGLAKEFKKHFPEMYDEYRIRCENNEIKPGQPYVWKNKTGRISVLNFPTKDHWKGKSRLEWIEYGLKFFCENYHNWDIKSIAFPALGCSNGGLDWEDVEPLMIRHLQKIHDITIEIYPPSTKPVPMKKNSLTDKRQKQGPRQEISLNGFTTADKFERD